MTGANNGWAVIIYFHRFPTAGAPRTIGLDVPQCRAIGLHAFSAKNYCVVAHILNSQAEIEGHGAHDRPTHRRIPNLSIGAIMLREQSHRPLQGIVLSLLLLLTVDRRIQ